MKSKITALVLAVSMIPSFSFADGTLTYESAFKKAVENNLSLERKSTTVDNIEKNLETGEGFKVDPNNKNASSVINSSIQYQSLIDGKKGAEMDYDAQKEALQINLKSIFSKIKYLELNNKLIQDKIANKGNNISIATVKYRYGMISKLDYDNLDLELKELNNSKKENELQIGLAYKDLSSLMGSDSKEKIKYIDIPFQSISASGMSKEAAIGRATSEAPAIYQQNAQIKILQERLKYDLLDVSSTMPKDDGMKSVKMQDIDLRISKQSLKDTVIETANNIQNMEIEIKNIKSQITNLQRQAKNIELLIKLGVKTKIELDNVNIQLSSLNLQLENTIANHGILLERYKKPYLLSIQ